MIIFGNCKTTLLASTIKDKNNLNTKIGKLKIYNWLSQLPNDETGLILGSSGLEQDKFVEIIVQGKKANEIYDLKIGDNIFEK